MHENLTAGQKRFPKTEFIKRNQKHQENLSVHHRPESVNTFLLNAGGTGITPPLHTGASQRFSSVQFHEGKYLKMVLNINKNTREIFEGEVKPLMLQGRSEQNTEIQSPEERSSLL